MRKGMLLCICVGVIVLLLVVAYRSCRKPYRLVDRFYYINLDRRPDRNHHMLEQMKKEQIDMRLVERFPAFDGDTLELTPEQESMFARADYLSHTNKKRIMGNQWSHYSILLDMLQHNYDRVLVLQDDVVFKDGFLSHLEQVVRNTPPDAEIVNLGWHKESVNQFFVPVDLQNEQENNMECKADTNPFVCQLHDHTNPCSLAYLVTRKGAANLVKYFQNTGFLHATDWNYNVYLTSKNIHYASKKVLCTGALMGSDIF